MVTAPRLKRMLWIIVITIIAGYLGLCGFMFLFQNKLLYFPTHDIYTAPDRHGLSYEEVFLTTADNCKLWAWFLPVANARGTVLFCHGNAGNLTYRLSSMLDFYDARLNVLIFDYRGYGKSEGSPSESGTYQDVTAAWRFLIDVKKIPANKIIVFGRSLGGAIAAYAASKNAPGALILESAFTSVPDLASQIYPLFPVRLLARYRYPTRRYLEGISCPVLIIHSREDEIVPFSHGQSLFAAAKDPKEFLAISGSHGDGFIVSQKEYQPKLEQFATRYFGP